MNSRTLPSGHNVRNSSLGGLRPWTLPLGHGGSPKNKNVRVSREKTFDCLKPECQSGGRTRDLRLSKQAASTTTEGPPALQTKRLLVSRTK